MNIPIPSLHSGAAGDIFFRTADRMRVEGCVNAVASEGMSLALSCAHEALLDHYVQLLLQRLRSTAPEHTLEVYFPANTESMIARFNEVLASQSLRQATRNAGPSDRQPAQIWLVHDAQSLPEQELQLLARLIQNFPGANIRAILLLIGDAPSHQSLSAFGRKLLRWDIEPPTPEQAEATLELARTQGQGEAVGLLLRRLGQRQRPASAWHEDGPSHDTPTTASAPASPAAFPAPSPASASAPTSSATTSAPARRWPFGLSRLALASLLKPRTGAAAPTATSATSAAAPLAEAAQATRPTLLSGLSAWRQRSPLLAAGVGALALSVLMTMWMQPAAFGLKGKGRANAASTSASEPAPAASAAKALAAQTPVVSVSTAAPAPTPIDVPDAAAEAQAWLRAMPAQQFVIQHGAHATYEKAQQMVKSYTSLREARVVAAWRPGEKLAYFVVVSGPYEGAGKAYERFGRKDLPNTSWVRTAGSLQQQLEPTPAPGKENR